MASRTAMGALGFRIISGTRKKCWLRRTRTPWHSLPNTQTCACPRWDFPRTMRPTCSLMWSCRYIGCALHKVVRKERQRPLTTTIITDDAVGALRQRKRCCFEAGPTTMSDLSIKHQLGREIVKKTLLTLVAATAITTIAVASVPIAASAQDWWGTTAVVNAGSGLVIIAGPATATAVVVPLVTTARPVSVGPLTRVSGCYWARERVRDRWLRFRVCG